MLVKEETLSRLAQIPKLTLRRHVPLSRHTRFGLGGPAEAYLETSHEESMIQALRLIAQSGTHAVVIGGGTNLVVSDQGFPGVVLRFTAAGIQALGNCVRADAGAELQHLVDFTTSHGLQGLETMTGIPGSVGAAVYGNAGAYGHSIMERVRSVRFYDGERVRELSNEDCDFRYRESVFKRRKDWIIFTADLELSEAPAADLQKIADDILKIRNQKYPPDMKCAGSIFKNLILADLPAHAREAVPPKAVREGKVASAWFLEQVGSKGLRNGGIHVADYHANLIYNSGNGTAIELLAIIDSMKSRVREQFGFDLEEEIQYVGFESR